MDRPDRENNILVRPGGSEDEYRGGMTDEKAQEIDPR